MKSRVGKITARFTRSRSSAGFTLLELLVAFSLLSLMFAMMTGGLRFGIAAWEKSQTVSDQITDVQLAQQYLRRQLEQAQALKTGRRRTRQKVVFSGTPRELLFVGRPPAHLQQTAFILYRVSIESSGNSDNLQVGWRHLASDFLDFEQNKKMESFSVLENVGGLRFSYFGTIGNKEAPRWVDRWVRQKRLPLLIKLDGPAARGDQNRWPKLIVDIGFQAAR